MAHRKSITFFMNSERLRFSEMDAGGILVELPGEHGWEDAYAGELSAPDVEALIRFLQGEGL